MSDSPFAPKPRGLIQLKPQTPQRNASFGSRGGGGAGATPGGGDLDLSITLAPYELQRLLDQTQQQQFNSTSSFLGADAISMSERSLLEAGVGGGGRGRGGVGDASEQLFKRKTDMLFPQFLEVLQGRTNDSEVFDTIQDLIHTCAGMLDETQKEECRSGGGGVGFGAAATGVAAGAKSAWLEEELKTWKLLFALYKDRIMLQGDGMDCEVPSLGCSEKEVITQLYSCNSTLREYQLIVDWLEACYERSDAGSQIGHSNDRSLGWENTLFQLLKQKEIAFGAAGVEIVKSLDPDAPVREKRALHALDEEDNARLSRCIFTEIRQGRIDEAMALCKYCGQTWRAAILEGWRLHEDPNYDVQHIAGTTTREKLPIEGNPRRDIWKKCAWLMADSKRYDEYTRAIAGAFCGHLESLKSLLGHSTWEDLLWAYLKVQIDIRVESEIRACSMRPYQQMPEAYWNAKMSMEQIFDELAVHNDASVRDYAHKKVGIIQKYLILDNIGELLQQMRRWVDEACDGNASAAMSPHLLRFLTHIVLFMRQIGRVDKEDTADRIIAAYVECLIGLGDAQLVAFYTAALPSKLQVLLYSKFLEGIVESSARSTALEEAISAGLDVENITRHTVESIRQRMPSESEAAAATNDPPQVGDIGAFDQRKIRSLEWLTFLPTQRGELLWQANAMIRYFLGESKSACVRATYEMVPSDSLSQIINVFGSKENFPCREECSVKEYLGYKIYLAALDSFDEWSRLQHSRPKAPQLVQAGANFTERIASEHKEQVYRGELNRWNVSLEEQSKVTRDSLFNVLLFPEKGWLIDPETPKDPVDISEMDWENRQVQLEKLRSICIPEMALLVHKVMHHSGDYKGCVKLADEIASESRQLYKVYTKHKLAELLSKLAESSLELLNHKVDPFGFPATA